MKAPMIIELRERTFPGMDENPAVKGMMPLNGKEATPRIMRLEAMLGFRRFDNSLNAVAYARMDMSRKLTENHCVLE